MLYLIAEEARVRLRERRDDDALWFERQIPTLRAATGDSEAESLLSAIFTVAEFALSVGRPGWLRSALDLVQHGTEVAQARGERAHERKMLHATGVLLRRVGQLEAAVEVFTKSLEVATELGDTISVARALSALGSTAFDLGWFESTISLCRQALAVLSPMAGSSQGRDIRMQCNQAIAEASMHLTQRGTDNESLLVDAQQTIRNAVIEAGEPSNRFEATQAATMRATQAALMGRLGRLDEMEDAVTHCERYAAFAGNAATIFRASLMRLTLDAMRRSDEESVEVIANIAHSQSPQSETKLESLYSLAVVATNRGDSVLHKRATDELWAAWQQRSTLTAIAKIDALTSKYPPNPLEDLNVATVQAAETLAVVGEIHDDDTGQHVFRVGAMAALVALELGMSEDAAQDIDYAARLHDIGKLAVHAKILAKAGPLTMAEWEVMRRHTTIGHEILSRVSHPIMELAADIALYHHERWDGQGYPRRLAGDAIPLAARITTVADVFDALTHPRAYKVAWSLSKAVEELERLKGQAFEPRIVDACVRVIKRLVSEVGEQGLDRVLSARASENPTVVAKRVLARTGASSTATAHATA